MQSPWPQGRPRDADPRDAPQGRPFTLAAAVLLSVWGVYALFEAWDAVERLQLWPF